MTVKPNLVMILGAAYGTGNMGVDALLSGTIASVLHGEAEAEIVLLDFGHEPRIYRVPGPWAEVEVRLENLRFSWKLWLRNNGFRLLVLALLMRVLPIPSFQRRIMAAHPALEVIANCKIALSLAGGDSFSDIYGFRRLLYVCLPQFLVLAMGRPLVLLPQTLGPFKTGWARWMGLRVMTGAMKVYSRDQASLALGREMLGGDPAHLGYSQDMAFALEPRAPRSGLPDWLGRGEWPLVGLNVSGLLFMGGYNRDNMFGLQGDYPELMRSLIRYFTLEAGADVVLVTHVTGWEGDEKACAKLYEELESECAGRLHLADSKYDHREIKYLIGKCDFFLGARMHACIAALSQGVPAVGLAYSRKFVGVFESVGVPGLVVDLCSTGNEEAVKRIRRLFEKRAEHAQQLSSSASRAKTAAESLFASLTVCQEKPFQPPLNPACDAVAAQISGP